MNADSDQIMIVVRNLISNAIKFNKKGGSVTVEAVKKDEMVEVSVSDTGIGIPKESHEKIFQLFYQMDHGLAKKYGGTGIGLAVSREIIKAHGGRLHLKASLGRGAGSASHCL